MGKNRKQLSQAEVWDDSALLRSWDDALTEYKLYHSIHVRGERVEDVIKEAEAEENEEVHMAEENLHEAAAGPRTTGIPSQELEDGELGGELESTQAYPAGDSIEDCQGPSNIGSEQKERLANANIAVDQRQKPGIPDAILNGVKDETLKNLMMSWYYAGYYTGLYEGQQQVQSIASKKDK